MTWHTIHGTYVERISGSSLTELLGSIAMRLHSQVVAPLTLSLLLAACEAEGPAEGWVPRAEFREIPQLKKEALSGSSVAARRLASYYMKFPVGEDTHDYWSRIAAENGSGIGQLNHAHHLSEAGDELSKIRAEFWLKRAAENGHDVIKADAGAQP